MNSSPSPAAAVRPRRWRRAVIVLLCLALLGGGTYFAWAKFFARPDESAKLQFATVTRGDIEEVVTATGNLQPRDYVDVGAQVSGQLEKLHVEIGAEVKASELLAEIDPTVLQSRVDAARAQLRAQRAQLMDREATLKLSQVQLKRQQNLMAEDATTTESVQSAEAALLSAQAQVEALKAQIEQAESNLRADEANLDYARIYAPISGTVVSFTARQGQTLNAIQQAPVIMRIADLSTMTVQTQVSEADVSRLRIGMNAYFTTLGSQERRWYGTLRKIEPTPVVQNNVVLYNALFDVPNPNLALMTQMTAQVFFVVASAKDALLVPMSALASKPPRGDRKSATSAVKAEARPDKSDASGATQGEKPRAGSVRVSLADGTIQDRAVEIGVSNRIQAQIVSGLEEGESVVTGTNAAPPGAPRRTPRL